MKILHFHPYQTALVSQFCNLNKVRKLQKHICLCMLERRLANLSDTGRADVSRFEQDGRQG